MNKFKKNFRNIQKLPTWIFFIPSLILKFCKIFLFRTKFVDPYNALKRKKFPYITVVWHNRLLYFPAMIPKKYRKRTYALISPSRDGQYLADLLKFFQVKSLRGSSFKKGAKALNDSIEVLNKGYTLSITPDGPRGPKYKMSKGPIILASKTGYPILPLSINSSRYWELKSWDNFRIPKPFSKLQVVFGKPIYIPGNLSDAELEGWREKIEKELKEVSYREMY